MSATNAAPALPQPRFYPALDLAPYPGALPARLALADGLVFEGWSCGATGEVGGELCFNTAMTGYQEILTDPSYQGQIVTLTMPQIGNYGITADDSESRACFCSGLVVRQMCREPSNFAATSTVPDWLREHGVVAIEGIDTRLLVEHIREQGATMAVISTDGAPKAAELVAQAQKLPPLKGQNLTSKVARNIPYQISSNLQMGTGLTRRVAARQTCPLATGENSLEPQECRKIEEGDREFHSRATKPQSTPSHAARMSERSTLSDFSSTSQDNHLSTISDFSSTSQDNHHLPYRVVALDAGIKFNIIRSLTALGCELRVLPPTTPAADILGLDPDGLFLSNGPGDPAAVDYLYRTVAELIGALPIFGICLGHQMLSLAVGAHTYKLKYGHHGGNHPVKKPADRRRRDHGAKPRLLR